MKVVSKISYDVIIYTVLWDTICCSALCVCLAQLRLIQNRMKSNQLWNIKQVKHTSREIWVKTKNSTPCRANNKQQQQGDLLIKSVTWENGPGGVSHAWSPTLKFLDFVLSGLKDNLTILSWLVSIYYKN